MRKRLIFLGICMIITGAATACNVSTKLKIRAILPDFITSNDNYYVTRIGDVPQIDPETYRLNVTGLVDRPRSFTLKELSAMATVDLPLTVECIGNTSRGRLISTAVWKGFLLADLLESLGLDPRATGVKYTGADGYFASHTMEQVKENGCTCGTIHERGNNTSRAGISGAGSQSRLLWRQTTCMGNGYRGDRYAH